MSNTSKNDFIKQVVIPLKQSNTSNCNAWLLVDGEMDVLLASDGFAEMIMSDNSPEQKLTKKITDLLPFDGEFDRDSYIGAHRKVLLDKSIQRKTVTLRVNDNLIFVLISMIPIFFKNEVIAIEEYIFNVNVSLYRRGKLKSYLASARRVAAITGFVKTKSEEQIIYLLLLGKKQREIAEIMGLSRSRITQLIVRMCTRAGIYGWSSKMLIESAISANYHKRIPPEFLINI